MKVFDTLLNCEMTVFNYKVFARVQSVSRGEIIKMSGGLF